MHRHPAALRCLAAVTPAMDRGRLLISVSKETHMKNLILVCLGWLACQNAFGACSFDIEVGDALKYSVTAIEASSDCESVTINLKHTGTLPAVAMGHNWVLTSSSDFQSVAKAGVGAGLPGNYLPADDPRIIASTKIIGGGESASVTFSLEGMDAAGDYTFFCSFPGHWGIMKGPFKIV
jgi:azurin